MEPYAEWRFCSQSGELDRLFWYWTREALEKEAILDERLKHLMQELGNAINEALSDSERIAEVIGDIRNAGYDVFLVLEATIGFNKREETDEEEESAAAVSENAEAPASERPSRRIPPRTSTGKIKLTSQDQKFLRALKISIDDES